MTTYKRIADVEFKIGDTDQTVRVSGVPFEVDKGMMFMADVTAAMVARLWVRDNETHLWMHPLHAICICHSPVKEG